MTRGGDARARAFTLAELLVSAAVMISLWGVTCLSGWGYVRRFTDPRSDAVMSREAQGAAEWLQSVISRALWKGEDFDLNTPISDPGPCITVRWSGSPKTEEWRSGIALFKHEFTTYESNIYHYSANFQTITPSLSLHLYYADGRHEYAGWIISVSGNSFVRVYRES
jgi:hypothetical protein